MAENLLKKGTNVVVNDVNPKSVDRFGWSRYLYCRSTFFFYFIHYYAQPRTTHANGYKLNLL